jgi:hypothetical protein
VLSVIVLIVTGAHRYTHRSVAQSRRFDFRTVSYRRVLCALRLPRATYIFADLDRLGFWELELSGRLFRELRASGLRVLNDPGRARQRFSLLRALHDRQFNDFDVMRVEDDHRPRRFPVFLRTQSAHRGPLSGLLRTREEVEGAIDAALAAGVPRKELMLVEYCAEPLKDGVFRKLAAFRIGDTMVPALSVHESKWAAKHGEIGVAGADLYEQELRDVAANRHGERIRAAFDVAEIEYGRADFGMVGGRPQVYEINTNPMIGAVKDHPFPSRLESARLCAGRYEDAMAAIDTPSDGWVPLHDESLRRQRSKGWWISHARWLP